MTPEPLSLLTEPEAAAMLHVSTRTLRSLRQRGLIRYVAVTQRRILYRREDCAAFVESRVKVEEAKPEPQRHRRRGSRQQPNVVSFTARRNARLAGR